MSHPLEIVSESSDEQLSVAAQLQSGMLSSADARKLRKLIGAPTFAEWVDSDRREPFKVVDARLLRVCQARQLAVAQARELARVAAWMLVPEVVEQVQL